MAARQSSGHAGDYWIKATILKRTAAVDSNTGQMVETFTPAIRRAWCWVEEKKLKQELDYGSLNHTVEADIHFRGYPDVAEKDKVQDPYGERVYQIKGIRFDFGIGETIVEGYQVASVIASPTPPAPAPTPFAVSRTTVNGTRINDMAVL